MASSIDPTKPADGTPAVKSELRSNLAAAKDEIEALQNAKIEAGQPFDMQGELLSRPLLKDYAELSSTPGIVAGTLTLDLEQGNVVEVLLDQDVSVLDLQNPPAAGRAAAITLILRQNGSGGHTVTWPATIKWAGGQAPVVSAGANALDVYALLTRDGGTTWFGFPAGQGFA